MAILSYKFPCDNGRNVRFANKAKPEGYADLYGAYGHFYYKNCVSFWSRVGGYMRHTIR